MTKTASSIALPTPRAIRWYAAWPTPHTNILECVVEADDEVMEKYLGGEEITPAQVATIFAKAMEAGTVIPIVFTDARKEIGIKELLDPDRQGNAFTGRRSGCDYQRRRH